MNYTCEGCGALIVPHVNKCPYCSRFYNPYPNTGSDDSDIGVSGMVYVGDEGFLDETPPPPPPRPTGRLVR